MQQLFIGFEKVYNSVGREVVYNILTGFGTPTKPMRSIKMCLMNSCKVRVGKNLSNEFPTHNSLKQ
jgi:hypothetical protein